MVSERAVIAKAFRGAVNKKHGMTIGPASNMRAMDLPRLSTRSLNFDVALGGGVPVGRLTIFRGEKSSAKTTNALRVVALAQDLCANCLRPVADLKVVEVGFDKELEEMEYEAVGTCDCYQKGIFKPHPYPDEYSDREKGTMKQVVVDFTDPKTGKTKKKKTTLFKERVRGYETNSYEEYRVAFFDFEGTLDLKWATALGVDVRRLLLSVPGSAEEGIDIYDEFLRTGAADLFLVDSIAAMTPSIESEASTEDEQRAAQAKLVNKFVRKVIISVNNCWRDFRRLPTQIWINQERSSMAKFGPDKIMPAGRGQEFGASIIVTMWPSKWDKGVLDDGLKKDFQLEIGKEVRMNFKVINNKTTTAQASGGYIMRVIGRRKGVIEEFRYVLDQATKYGLFREVEDGKKKKWFLGNEEFDKKGAALARMEEPAVFQGLKDSLLKKILHSIDTEE